MAAQGAGLIFKAIPVLHTCFLGEDYNQGPEEGFGSGFAVCWWRMELFWGWLARNILIFCGKEIPMKHWSHDVSDKNICADKDFSKYSPFPLCLCLIPEPQVLGLVAASSAQGFCWNCPSFGRCSQNRDNSPINFKPKSFSAWPILASLNQFCGDSMVWGGFVWFSSDSSAVLPLEWIFLFFQASLARLSSRDQGAFYGWSCSCVCSPVF